MLSLSACYYITAVLAKYFMNLLTASQLQLRNCLKSEVVVTHIYIFFVVILTSKLITWGIINKSNRGCDVLNSLRVVQQLRLLGHGCSM